MTSLSFLGSGAVLVAASLSACLGGSAGPPTGRLAIDVAPLSLAGISDATYTLTVHNGPGGTGDVVWTKTVTSQQYGDGAGSISYVGSCDAATGVNTVTLELLELRDASGVVATSSYMNPTPVSREATCVEGGDVAVQFDITMARRAEQGFFDVAVQFQDIFCSAKLDCQRDDGSDLELLHDATGARAMTVVLGFACTGSVTGTTFLYMDDLVVDCSGLASDVRVSPTGLGNVALPAGDNPGGYLFGAAVYRGVEGFASKAYWNVSLGLDASTFAGSGVCVLRTRATASAEAFPQEVEGFPLPAGSVYPVIEWAVTLSDDAGVDGRRVCTQHEVDGADGGVATSYLGYLPLQNGFTWSPGPIYLQHRFQPIHPPDPNGQVLSAGAPICNPSCAHGACVADGAGTVCDCTGTGYAGAACDVPVCSDACVSGTCVAPDTCACTAGFWGPTCAAACTVCGAGEYEQSTCTDVADRVCAACDAIANCEAGSLACTGPDDEACSNCVDGYFGPSCAPCAAACVAGEFEETACTDTTDRVCTSCTDVANCAVTETCTSSADSLCATCVSGYAQLSAGAACTDVDECTDGTDNCDANAACTNTVGGFTCACDPGYSGDGVTCTACPAGQVQPDSGQSSCIPCGAGTYDDGDEVCGTCAATCTATQYEAVACTSTTNRLCVTCTDVANCAVAETCTTSADSVCATCVSGYTQLSAGAACTDIDECAGGTDNCDVNATCANTAGGFTCTCNTGYYGADGTSCQPCAQGECLGAVTCDPYDGSARVCTACDNGYTGTGCEVPPETCSDLVGTGLPDGVYTIDPDGAGGAAAFDVYCDADRGWTLIESFSYANRATTRAADFAEDLPLNEGTPANDALHRLSKARIVAIEAKSTEWMATCNLDTSERRDFVRVTRDELNPTTYVGTPGCPTAEAADIRGYACTDCLVPVWQNAANYHLHIDSSGAHCGGEPWVTGSVASEDNFGYYAVTANPAFSCSASDAATTNFWMRNRPCALGSVECSGGVAMACNPSGTALEAVEDCGATGKACVAGACVAAAQTCGELVGQGLSDGVYKVDPDGAGVGLAAFDAYCDLTRGWTLYESFSYANKAQVAAKSLTQNVPLNETSPSNLALHRLSLAKIQALEAASTEWMATCNLDTSEASDFIRASLASLSPSTYLGANICKTVTAANIRGTGGCSGCTVPFWQTVDVYHLHTDSSFTTCGSRTWNTGAVASEDDFGFYSTVNSAFPCTASAASTTQWWVRDQSCTPNAGGCSGTVATRCNSLGTLVEPVEDCALSGRTCVDGACEVAGSNALPAASCNELRSYGLTTDGWYWVDPTGAAPVWVYCDMTTDGGGWTRVATEDFESGSTAGWSYNSASLSVTTCGSYGKILGGYNVLAGNYVLKTYSWAAPIPHTTARLTIDYIKIDSWDTEPAYVNFTEPPADPATGTYWTQLLIGGTEVCGSTNAGWTEQRIPVTLTIAHTTTSANVRASSGVNQAANDESWGIDNVVIWIR
ncbi:MAG: hypothetical protein EP329_05305 [Deltaproteobacteria bacterium]|nr:MAG: hypothetical protein EP329_05305 [Deltaproteobacteria bacterium]